ncbi:MAG: hypothetical protein PHX30_00620 [Candidatus Pacebacteria bacterium]|nr:hypothetical protein [Candidatus Paceibacterota bacterium]
MQGSAATNKTDDRLSKNASREEEERVRIQKVWEWLQTELTENKRREFKSLSLEEKMAVLELQRQGYVSVCRLLVKIIEAKRGSDFVTNGSGRSQ